MGSRSGIIDQLYKEILPLQGFKKSQYSENPDFGLGPINEAFPNHIFPLGAVHEFICQDPESVAVTNGFISAIITTLMHIGGTSIWICNKNKIFPPALQSFGITPERIIFLDLSNEKDIMWAMEESLKFNKLSAVIGELTKFDFTFSRRLQLIVEQSNVTCFVVRSDPRNNVTTASIAKWKITSLPSETEDLLPGIGFPRWNVELLKIRNGKTGCWQMEWASGKFRHMKKITTEFNERQKKTA